MAALTTWSVSPEWSGETVFVIGGGPSVAGQDLAPLAGRKVIVVNSSCHLVPERLVAADILFFADARWWRANRNKRCADAFAGRVVATCDEITAPNVLHLKKKLPPGLATARDELTVLKTSVTGAINLAVHLGAKKIVLLGVDGGPDASGRTHHHEPHDWGPIAANWQKQRDELCGIAPEVAARGVEVLNASPGSQLTCWPIVDLAEILESAMQK